MPSRDVPTVLDYHQRTSHRFEAYAAGPATLDWDAQPDPFRRYAGSPLLPLPLTANTLDITFTELAEDHGCNRRPFDLHHAGALFELSFAISAWKEFAGDRWALRCNPSSGNLHPTESYALPLGFRDVEPALYHYRADEHALESRCPVSFPTKTPGILIGLSSIHWREAWKYGERAFRYSQLDIGHAMGALSYAAATLGWQCQCLPNWSSDDIATLLGLHREADFADAEPEFPEVLLWISHGEAPPEKEALLTAMASAPWQGQASRLDPKPLYHWPVIDEVDSATRLPALENHASTASWPSPLPSSCQMPAADIIRLRRSAQHFDPRYQLPKRDFFRMLDALLPRPEQTPWRTALNPVRTHLILFVHQVEGIRSGLYALVRRPDALDILKAGMRDSFLWETVDGAPEGLPLYALVHANARNAARNLSCHQDIAGHSAFAMAMLGEFDGALAEGAWAYRHLYREAGLIGQTLYLEAEAAGIRGTGIGCYFDPAVHDTLGITGTQLQSMYHFTVGLPLTDNRLQTLPPYTHLPRFADKETI